MRVFAVRFRLSCTRVEPVANTPRTIHIGGAALTRREYEVLPHLVKAETNAEIARNLGIREQTVKDHVSALYRKFGVGRRVALAVAAVRAGL
jgi:two-component system nitrate/nitrite response regulator NarL